MGFKLAPKAISLLLVLALSVNLAFAALAHIPRVATDTTPYIVLPSYTLPSTAKPGGYFEVLVRSGEELKVEEAYIVGLKGSYSLGPGEALGFKSLKVDPEYSMSVFALKFKVPEGAVPGLYNLIIRSKAGQLWMPNAILVDGGIDSRACARIAHLTDVHFGAEQGGYPNNFKHTRFVVLINTLVERLSLDLAIYTGDLIDVGSDIRAYRDFFRVTSQILAPQLALPGNHDWAQVDNTRSFVEMYYGRYVNPLRVWNFTYGRFMFVSLDTRMQGYPEMWQLDFLEDVVRNSGGKLVIIAFHHPFFNTAGSYKGGIENFRGYVYSSWRQSAEAESVARRLLDIINKYSNIVAVLSGHIHRDADSIYERADGSKVYFITTVTSNHGYPKGYYWGVKLVEVCGDGSVKVLTPGGRGYTPTSGSINTEAFKVFEVTDAYNTAVSWVFNTTGFAELDVGNMTLVFYLNKTVPLESYKLYGDTGRVHSVVSYDLGLYHLVKAYVNLKGSGSITMASYEDKTPPRIRVISMSPREPALGRPLVFVLEASDTGWGIKTVEAIVSLNGKPVARVEAQRMMEPTQFRLVYNVRDPGKYDIILRALDFNGNTGETRIEFNVGAPQTETPTPTETPTETITPTETPRETLTTITISEPATTTAAPQPAEKAEFPTQIVLLALIIVIVLAVVLVFKFKKRS